MKDMKEMKTMQEMKKKIIVYLFDGFSDWEIAYFTPEIKKSDRFELIYCSENGQEVCSMGGLRVTPQLSLSEIKMDDLELIVLPGGTFWENPGVTPIDDFIKNAFQEQKPIAAICGATIYLARMGMLNEVNHTSNDLNYLKMVAPEYTGEQNYINAPATTGQNIITACGIAPIEFAQEIFRKIALYDEPSIKKWFDLFKHGIWSE